MTPVRIAVDIDGCVADFVSAYHLALGQTSGRYLFEPGHEPSSWFHAEPQGYTKEEDAAAWKAIHESRTFWGDLLPLTGAVTFLDTLSRWVAEENWLGAGRLEVYFMTARNGPRVKAQTEAWLKRYGWFGGLPTVLIVPGDKGDVARALRLSSVVDDRPENLFSIRKSVRSCQTIKRQAKYNLWADEGGDGELITHRVHDVNACLPIWRELYERTAK